MRHAATGEHMGEQQLNLEHRSIRQALVYDERHPGSSQALAALADGGWTRARCVNVTDRTLSSLQAAQVPDSRILYKPAGHSQLVTSLSTIWAWPAPPVERNTLRRRSISGRVTAPQKS